MRDSSKSRCQAGVVSLKMWNGFPLPTLLRVNSIYVHSKNAAFRAWIVKETRTSCRTLYSVLLYVIFGKTGQKMWKVRFQSSAPQRQRWRQSVDLYRTDIRALNVVAPNISWPEFYPNPTECREDRQNLVDSFKKTRLWLYRFSRNSRQLFGH